MELKKYHNTGLCDVNFTTMATLAGLYESSLCADTLPPLLVSIYVPLKAYSATQRNKDFRFMLFEDKNILTQTVFCSLK